MADARGKLEGWMQLFKKGSKKNSRTQSGTFAVVKLFHC